MKVVRNCVKVWALVAGVLLSTGVGELSLSYPVGATQYRAQALIEAEATRTVTPELLAAAASTDPAIEERALLALGRTKNRRAADALTRGVASRDPGVRTLAVYGLGLLGNMTSIAPAQFRGFFRDPASSVRAAGVDAAQRSLGFRPASASLLIPELVRLMRSDPEPIVRGRAAAALAAGRDLPGAAPAGVALVAAFERERAPDVRRHEAWAMRRGFPSAPSEAQIAAGLRDPDELVRMQFVAAVGSRKQPDLVRLLRPLLHDASWRVAEQAYESVKILAGGTRTEHLTAIPDGVGTPEPVPDDTSPPLPRPTESWTPRKPVADDARVDIPLLVTASAKSLDGPMPGKHPRVRIMTTKGPIVLRLYPEWAPLTVANFLNLTNHGFFDGQRWFRIVPNFVVQTGDPHDNGDGDAGYMIPAEENPLEQRTGVISMGLNYTSGANPGPIRDSAGTQFYITISPQLHLNRDFTVFGEIESGFPTLGRLIEADRMTKVEQIGDD